MQSEFVLYFVLWHPIEVIWFFDRGGDQLKYEICKDDNGEGFLLITTGKDGTQKVERINQPSDLIERSVNTMRQLRKDGWKLG